MTAWCVEKWWETRQGSQGEFAGVAGVFLELKKRGRQVENCKGIMLDLGPPAGVHSVLLVETTPQCTLRIFPWTEVVQPSAGLFGPAFGGVRKEGEVWIGFGRLVAFPFEGKVARVIHSSVPPRHLLSIGTVRRRQGSFDTSPSAPGVKQQSESAKE